MINEAVVKELLSLKPDASLQHRESQVLEFKEQFNYSGFAEYFRDFAAFSNNKGGYLIYGVSNSPRRLVGMTPKSVKMFEDIDPERISGFLNELFSPEIVWEQAIVEFEGKKFGVFRIEECLQKPVVAKKDEGRNLEIKNGDIFYRYAGRTQHIQFSEIAYIINERVTATNNQWLSLMGKIARTGPANAAILDTETGVIERTKDQVLVVDESLVNKIKFIKEGDFQQTKGATTLKLIGDVVPINSVEVTKTIQRRLTDLYPLSFQQLREEVMKVVPEVSLGRIFEIIKENDLKNDQQYSAYNFRNKAHEEEFQRTSALPSGTPSIYNHAAVGFILNILRQE